MGQIPDKLKADLVLNAFASQHFVSTLLLDEACRLVTFNNWAIHRFQAIAGKTLEEGRSFLDYLPNPFNHVFQALFEQALDGGVIEKEFSIPEYNLEKPLWVKAHLSRLHLPISEPRFVALNIINTNAQREAEAEIRHKTKLFEEVFDSGAEGKAIIQFEEKVSPICNRKLLHLLGINTHTEFVEDFWPIIASSLQIVKGKIPGDSHCEFYIQTTKGAFLAHCALSVFHFNHEIYGILKVSDVTIERRISKQIKDQDELFKLVSKATNDGVYKYDLREDKTWCSDEYIQMMGYPVEEVMHHPNRWFTDKINPDDLAHIHRQLEEVRSGNRKQIHLEYRIRRADGTYIHVIDRGFISSDAHGVPTTVVGAITDVTKIRENEDKLEKSERMLQDILETIDEIVYSFKLFPNLRTEFEYFSKQDIETWGFQTIQLVGPQNLWYKNIYTDDRRHVIYPALKKLLALEKCEVEYRFRQKDGSTCWIYSQLVPSATSSGYVRVTGSAMDITERKLFEEKLLIQNEELKKINEELDRFVYSASHDLRSPLTSILGLINLFHYENASPQQMEYIEMIRQSVNRLDNFITNIVDYSRNARIEVAYEPILLEKMLEDTLESLQFMEGYENVTKNISIGGIVPFYSDPMRMQLILNNLISNCIKYQRKTIDYPTMDIEAIIEADKLHMVIRDNGVGIDPALLPRVFDMFFKGEVNNHGSGIGLYIVRESVLKLGGEIKVNGNINTGCSFIMEIPNRYATIIYEEKALQRAASSHEFM